MIPLHVLLSNRINLFATCERRVKKSLRTVSFLQNLPPTPLYLAHFSTTFPFFTAVEKQTGGIIVFVAVVRSVKEKRSTSASLHI
jgi:hypothetical protein